MLALVVGIELSKGVVRLRGCIRSSDGGNLNRGIDCNENAHGKNQEAHREERRTMLAGGVRRLVDMTALRCRILLG